MRAEHRTASKVPTKKPVKRSSELDPLKVSVASVMSKKVKTTTPDTSVSSAIAAMMESEVGQLPVVDDEGRLVGILSKTDLVREQLMSGGTAEEGELRISASAGVKYSPGAGFHEEAEALTSVSDLMSARVRTVLNTASLAEAAAVMSKLHVHGLPVVTAANSLVGFISAFDIVDWVAHA